MSCIHLHTSVYAMDVTEPLRTHAGTHTLVHELSASTADMHIVGNATAAVHVAKDGSAVAMWLNRDRSDALATATFAPSDLWTVLPGIGVFLVDDTIRPYNHVASWEYPSRACGWTDLLAAKPDRVRVFVVAYSTTLTESQRLRYCPDADSRGIVTIRYCHYVVAWLIRHNVDKNYREQRAILLPYADGDSYVRGVVACENSIVRLRTHMCTRRNADEDTFVTEFRRYDIDLDVTRTMRFRNNSVYVNSDGDVVFETGDVAPPVAITGNVPVYESQPWWRSCITTAVMAREGPIIEWLFANHARACRCPYLCEHARETATAAAPRGHMFTCKHDCGGSRIGQPVPLLHGRTPDGRGHTWLMAVREPDADVCKYVTVFMDCKTA